MKNAEISIITPFHNVDIGVFEQGLNSLKAQTYGFENIEWIVVLHNCDSQYIREVHRLCDEYENIIVDELNNDIHTPSSPRNRGLSLARGRYVGFLDGDDRYTPDCVQEVLYYMKKNEADITWFRREYELEDENSLPITEVVLWSQIKKEIIITRDNWDSEKMFSGLCGMVTSRMYDRLFLEKNNISFDESVPFAEDYLFNVEAYGCAQRICYLPQTIGYTYYINGSSLVQRQNKDGQTLVAYARGYKKLFDRGLQNGFFMNAIMSRLMVVLCRFMTTSKSLTIEERKEIRDILLPYVYMTTPLRVSKLYSEMTVKESYEVPRDVILNVEKWDKDSRDGDFLSDIDIYDGFSLQQFVLRRILESNMDTDMGEEYDFGSIYTISGFRKKIPMTDYDYYMPLIELNTRIGESGIFVKEPITNYLLSKGSSQKIRILPCTKSFIEDYGREFYYSLKGHRSFLVMDATAQRVRYNDRTSATSIYGMMLEEFVRRHWHGEYKDATIINDDFRLFYEKPTQTQYKRVLKALLDDSITQLFAPNTWHIIMLLNFIRTYKSRLIQDIRAGRIFTSGEDDTVVTEVIKADPQRADIVREALGDGTEPVSLKRLWPKLTRVIACGNGEFSFYTDKLWLQNEDVEFYNGSLFYPEFVLGRGVEGSNNEYSLILGAAFWEFALYDEKEGRFKGELRMAQELRPGDIARVYVTNKSGLYRYNSGKVIRISRVEGDRIFFCRCDEEFNFLLVKGVRVSQLEVKNAVTGSLAERISDFEDYAFAVKGNSLDIYLEAAGRISDMAEYSKELAERVDGLLSAENEGYREKRTRGDIGGVNVKFLEPKTTQLYVESISRRLNISKDAMAPEHMLWLPADIRFYEANVMEAED